MNDTALDAPTGSTRHRPGTTSRRRLRRSAAAALAATLGLSLAACGDDGDSRPDPSAARTAANGDVFNDADVQFATDMIQHHAQALVMVDLAAGRPLDPQVQQLTEQIREAQVPEGETMVDWLTAWDQEIPATMRDHSNADHDMHGADGTDDDGSGSSDTGSGMPGMMSGDELDQLARASDAEFQDLWLQMMIEHHEGAVEMARDEQADGTFAEAVALAESIESSQQREVDRMQQLLE
ncbi:DUF305 domain-containing protein [Nocardioides taihuensis]|uniref:DUF305 domain-containing protein n=1 Tax=Nocardioides taihuensis TaxID=1835606 RepID=A0ABW0BLX9_9ACTN